MRLQDAIADLLDEASEEYSNHCCNDCSLPNTPESRKFVEEMNLDDGNNSEIHESEDGKYIETYDWIVLSRVAKLIRENGLPVAK